ncbi:MAG: hypothetical protein B7Z66_06565 [Chromatiales bacterium 21-64-14]|nr:MAG: hypothetical protein B7Z66_06565 [Chromatiales bacterium 21-64-14]HQU16557.1 Mth938-like domain-containing protein [Gammaproteobacteria bacterium]
MKISLDTASAAYVIRAYGPGRITVNDQDLTEAFVVTPEQLIRDWPIASAAELTSEHLQRLVDLDPEIILLGTGPTLRFPDPRLIAGLQQRGIGVEVMDTAAACRTYNILSAEDRRVVAALLMI